MHVACWIFHVYITNWGPRHAGLGAACATGTAQSLCSCTSYTISAAVASMLIWDIFLAWIIIKAKVDCCCQLRKQDCNNVPKVPASISPFFITSFGKWWHEVGRTVFSVTKLAIMAPQRVSLYNCPLNPTFTQLLLNSFRLQYFLLVLDVATISQSLGWKLLS